MGDGAAALRTAALADPGIAARLRGCGSVGELAARAAAAGVTAEAADLEELAGRGAQLAAAGRVPGLGVEDVVPHGLTPLHVALDGAVTWADLRGVALTDPFFEGDVRRALARDPARRLLVVRTGSSAVAAAAAGATGVLPVAGVLAHVSRCGSTLALRALATAPGVVPLSEPPVLEDALDAAPGLLPDLVRLLAVPRGPGDRCVVLKPDAWTSTRMRPVLAACGAPPWAALVRAPEEVLASQVVSPGRQFAVGGCDPGLLGLAGTDVGEAEWMARVLALLQAGLLAALDPGAVVVDYAVLRTRAGLRALAAHFGLALDGAALDEVLGRDAKAPASGFDAAARAADRPVSDTLRETAARVAGAGHAALLAHRTSKPLRQAQED